jgi:transcriptional regulator with XRE-family HTH domain
LPGSRSPTIRRRELGTLLRGLRQERGWTVEHVAGRLMVSTSKVSRQETGQRGISPRDIRDLANLYEVNEALRARLTELAAEGKQQAWWQASGIPYSTYVGLEAEATSISDFGLALVPGLLQTADYARETMRAIRPDFHEDVIELRAAARAARQRILTSQNPPLFEAIIDEAVLHRSPSNRSVMREQLEGLVAASDLPNVSIRVLPFRAGLLPSSNNKFIILTFKEPRTTPTTVFIETLTLDLFVKKEDQVLIYEKAFDVMREMSLTAHESRAMISSAAAALGD